MEPICIIKVNGNALSEELQARLISVRIHDEAGFSNDRMEISVDNRPPWISLPGKGDVFTVSLGFKGGTVRQMGTFEFDEVVASGPPHMVTVTTHAKDTGSGFKATQQRSWHGKTVGEIVSTIGGIQGMQVQVEDSLKNIKIEHIDQTAQSDMGFLTDLAKKNNAIMKVINQTIYFAPRDTAKSMDGQAVENVPIKFTNDMRYSYISQGRGNYSGVKARYFDKDKAKEMFMGAGDTDKVPFNLAELYTTKEEAQKAAESLNTTLARTRETLELILPGNPDLMAESPFTIEGFPPFIPTTWTADKTEHVYSSKPAYTTTLIGVTPNPSAGGGSGEGSGEAGSGTGGGPQEERAENQELGNDGFTPTEQVDENDSLPDPS